MSAPIKLSVQHLSKNFDGLEVLDDISLEVAEGEFVCIVGPSGCGKTTFLRIVGGLETTNGGVIEIDGNLVDRPGSDRGFVFQADSLLPWRRVFNNAFIGLEVNHHTSAEDKSMTRKLLELVGLGGFEDFFPRQLSGGMRQRVNLARAIAVNPEVLLMDEPCSSLDPIATAQVEELIDELKQNYSVVIVTHSMQQAARVSQKTAFFHLGDLVEFGETGQIFTTPEDSRTESYITGRIG